MLREGATHEQEARVVYKYLDNHPEKLHEPAGKLVSLALSEAFPCK